jgi:glutamate racemase
VSSLLGLFDSGVGGLTVLRQVLARRPGQRCLYLGDTARVPYGQRSPQEIRAIAAEVIRWLGRQGVDGILMACNTTNALAFDVAESLAGVPVLGLIDSAASQLQADRVGVLATPATAASGAYGHSIRAVHPGAEVVEVGCPAFVPLIEAGQLSGAALRQAAQTYLEPLLAARVDVIVLGCTHYPLLQPLLQELVPAGVLLVDPAVAAAARLDGILAPCLDQPAQRLERCCFRVTGPADPFSLAATSWLGERPEVRQVDLNQA